MAKKLSELGKLPSRREIFVHDRKAPDGSPVTVIELVDEANKIIYQVDQKSGVYREASIRNGVGNFGEWQELAQED